MGDKTMGYESHQIWKMTEFPSPCGEWVMKLVSEFTVDGRIPKFPSPCGEWVMKLPGIPAPECGRLRVSVPLRGMGNETYTGFLDAVLGAKFPSPCGEWVMKLDSMNTQLIQILKEFLSPCGEWVMKPNQTQITSEP